MENLTEVELGLVTAVDTSYLLLTGMNILLMQAGFTALEAGGSRAKNVKSLLFKNFMDHAVGSLAWFTVGWGLFIGSNSFAAGPDATFFIHPINQYARIFQQFAFAATAATIVSGAVTGRCRLEPYVVLSAFLSGISYPISAHWAWSSGGWLYQMGFLDFAGSQVVHGFGGAVALVTAWACGPRPGRFIENQKNRMGSNTYTHTGSIVGAAEESEAEHASSSMTSGRRWCPPAWKCRPISPRSILALCRRPLVYKVRAVPKGHNPPLMVIGSLMLYFAWFSFNAGSCGSIYLYPDGAVRAAVNTMLAPGAASLAHMVITILVGINYDIEMACNAMLAGLVAITAGSGFLDPWAAVVLGFLAAPIYILSAWFVLHVLGVDDILGAVSVHGTCGAIGTIWVGLTHPTDGLFLGGGARLLGVQSLGVLCIGSFGIVTAYLFIILPYKWLGKLSYTESEQLIGIDLVHFGGEFGKDVDLESRGGGATGMNSEREDAESNDGKSNNSNFVEEFPDISEPSGSSKLQHGPGSQRSLQTTGLPLPSHHGSLEFKDSNYLANGSSRLVRTFSTNTTDGRKAVNMELRRVLDEDPRVRHRFRAYLEVMHREEGVAFWDEVSRWKTISSKKAADKKIKEAKRIIKTYCLESGSKQVNLASKNMKTLTAALEDRDELLNNNLFDEALDELFKDLKHSFLEFVEQTPNYWM